MKQGSSARSSRHSSNRRRRSRDRGRRPPDAATEPIEASGPLDSDWVEWGGELIWAAGFTSGGAPYGLLPSDFDAASLEAMGFDPESARELSRSGDSDSWFGDDYPEPDDPERS